MDDVASRALVLLCCALCSPRATLRFLTSIKSNNGLSGFNFGPFQFQNLLYLASYDPRHPLFSAPFSSDTDCVLPYLGRVRNG